MGSGLLGGRGAALGGAGDVGSGSDSRRRPLLFLRGTPRRNGEVGSVLCLPEGYVDGSDVGGVCGDAGRESGADPSGLISSRLLRCTRTRWATWVSPLTTDTRRLPQCDTRYIPPGRVQSRHEEASTS